MNCHAAREQLPLFVTGDLPTEVATSLTAHLQACAACQREEGMLRRLVIGFAQLPEPETSVDLPGIFREAARQEQRVGRRWRNLALAATAIAAGVLLLLFVRVEVRGGDGQWVIALGTPQPTVKPNPPAVPPAAEPAWKQFEEKLTALQENLDLVLQDVTERDGARRQEIAALRGSLESIKQSAGAALAATQRDVSAMYAALFPGRHPTSGGEDR